MTKDDKKAEVLNAFPCSFFNSKASFLSNKLSELEDSNGEQNEDPSPRENGQKPDTPLRHNSIWLDWICQRVLRELEEILTEPASIITHSPGSPGRFKLTRGQLSLTRDTHQQEELEEGSGELQTCQPDCEAEESHGSSWEPS